MVATNVFLIYNLKPAFFNKKTAWKWLENLAGCKYSSLFRILC